MCFKFKLFLVVTSMFAGDSRAQRVPQHVLDHLVSSASAIVVGEVMSRENRPIGPKTTYVIEVEKYLHLDSLLDRTELITLNERGGQRADGLESSTRTW